MKPNKRTLLIERKAFVLNLCHLKEEAMRLGLIQTFRALDGATTAVGWEIAAYAEREEIQL